VNDYQIDVGTPAGRAEYKRVIDRAAEMGAEYVLFAPANSAVSRAKTARTIGAGSTCSGSASARKFARANGIRNPPRFRHPSGMLDYAARKKGSWPPTSIPYCRFAEPRMAGNRQQVFTRKKQNASLGWRSLQDWLIENLQTFYRAPALAATRLITPSLYDGTSRYAQWWGCGA